MTGGSADRNPWARLAVGVVVMGGLFLCMCVATLATFAPRLGKSRFTLLTGSRIRVTEPFATELHVSPPASLTVVNPVGDVTIRVGADDRIAVQATKVAHATRREAARELLERIAIHTGSTRDGARIEVELPEGANRRSANVDLEITVPRRTRLDLQIEVGDVQVDGTEGNVRLRTDVGDVWLRDVALLEEGDVRADVGDLHFTGELPHEGQVTFVTRMGSIHVAVPSDSPFILNAETGVGTIHNQFDLEAEKSKRTPALHWELHGRAGANPKTTLTVHTKMGDIHVEVRR